jgi:hypothetical protein
LKLASAVFSLCSSPSLLTLQEVIRTNTQLQSAARALADQLDMRMKDLEAQSQRRVAAEQASLQAETERLKQVRGRIRDVTGAPPACLGQKHDTKHLSASKHGCPFRLASVLGASAHSRCKSEYVPWLGC